MDEIDQLSREDRIAQIEQLRVALHRLLWDDAQPDALHAMADVFELAALEAEDRDDSTDYLNKSLIARVLRAL